MGKPDCILCDAELTEEEIGLYCDECRKRDGIKKPEKLDLPKHLQ